MPAVLLALACARPSRAPVWIAGRSDGEWAHVSVVARGDQTIEEERTYSVHRDGDAWRVQVGRTRVSTEGPDGVGTFTSDAPTAADPWPFVMRHAVSTAPARVQWVDGRLALLDPAAWSDAAQDALLRTSLPPDAISTGLPLVDPAGLEAELRRVFPGPVAEGVSVRDDHVAGLDAERSEQCVEASSRGTRTWRCDGVATDPAGRLRELTTWTELTADRSGLIAAESGYGGFVDARDHGLGLVVVAGRQRVQRVGGSR
jgi:hypothetical protein